MTRVIHRSTGLDYTLQAMGAGRFWLGANDGRVPGGQIVYGDSVTEVLERNPVLELADNKESPRHD